MARTFLVCRSIIPTEVRRLFSTCRHALLLTLVATAWPLARGPIF